MGDRAQQEFLAHYQMRDNAAAILNAFAQQEAR
jgi:hypothetical protein